MPIFLSSRRVRVLATIIISIVAVFILLQFYTGTHEDAASGLDLAGPEPPPHKGRLHLLIPATSTNSDLCKLLLSAQILGYPTPVLINYGDHESSDRYKQHLGKVEGILTYLEQLDSDPAFAEDLVLIIDGFDVWFQLRPDVLIKRYYAINAAADARAAETYGQDLVDENSIHQAVVFGPDKLCWPVDFSRPACWAIPASTLRDSAFGPPSSYEKKLHQGSDRATNPAQWLNSGTVIGPARDLRDVFRATLEDIQERYHGDSDQYYFSNIFGDQEYARIRRVPGLVEKVKERSLTWVDEEDNSGDYRFEPPVEGRRTEYHVGIDYELGMFQTLAFWKDHLSWTIISDAWHPPPSSSVPSSYPSTNPYAFTLPADIAASSPPFAALNHHHQSALAAPDPVLSQANWSSVPLLYNTLTHNIPVLIHLTGGPREKDFRLFWWSKLWFQAQARELREASKTYFHSSSFSHDEILDQTEQRLRISDDLINGLIWEVAEADEQDAEGVNGRGWGGVWTDRRGWLSWKRICKECEEEIMGEEGVREWFHPGRVSEPKEELEVLEEPEEGRDEKV